MLSNKEQKLYWSENIFFIGNHPSPLKQCCKTLRRCLFVSNIEKGERGGYFLRRDRAEFALRKKGGNFNVSQQLLSMIVAAQVLSESMAAVLKTFGPPEAAGMARLCEMVDSSSTA